LQKLESDEVQTILLTGCGGGFDFVHGMLLYPELRRLGKNVIIGSFSFGSPANINQAEVIFEQKHPLENLLLKKYLLQLKQAPYAIAQSCA